MFIFGVCRARRFGKLPRIKQAQLYMITLVCGFFGAPLAGPRHKLEPEQRSAQTLLHYEANADAAALATRIVDQTRFLNDGTCLPTLDGSPLPLGDISITERYYTVLKCAGQYAAWAR